MKVNKEEAACILLAFIMVACQAALIPLISNLMVSYSELTQGIIQMLATITIAAMAFVAVIKIPNSWHWKIIYDSTAVDQ